MFQSVETLDHLPLVLGLIIIARIVRILNCKIYNADTDLVFALLVLLGARIRDNSESVP